MQTLNDEKILFVTGIDTDIGKTFATASLAGLMAKQGKKVITQKLIQTGCKEQSEDILKHRELLGQKLLDVDKEGLTCPYILSYPASPHLAAQIDNVELDFEKLDQATDELLSRGYECILLEGAGGIMVPLQKDYLTIDFIAKRKYPVALVTSGRLGSINHTLLSLHACKTYGIEVKYLLFNYYPASDPFIREDTLSYLKDYLAKYWPNTQTLILEDLSKD